MIKICLTDKILSDKCTPTIQDCIKLLQSKDKKHKSCHNRDPCSGCTENRLKAVAETVAIHKIITHNNNISKILKDLYDKKKTWN